MKVAFEIDCKVLESFISVLGRRNYTPDEIIEKLMCKYVDNVIGVIPPPPPPGYKKYTEEFLERCKGYRVGEFVNIFLREFLERGVASEEEVEEMQKANGQTPCRELKIPFGLYCNKNFRTPFPLLIDESHRKYDKGNNFWVRPSTIYGKNLYLCSQWATQHRKSIEDWILEHLPEWFENASEDQEIAMKKFIEKNT